MPSARDHSYSGLGALKSSALAATTYSPPTRAIHVNVAGDIVGKLEEDESDGTFTVLAGMTYSYHFKSISSLGTATGRALY